MSYLDRMLLPGETITYRTRLHPLIFVKALIALALVIALASFLANAYPYLGATLLMVVCLPYTVLVVASFVSGEVAVTNRRVLLRMGALRSQFREVLLHKVTGTAVQKMPGGTGSVSMQTAGGVVHSASFVRDPESLEQAILQARKKLAATKG